MYKYHLYLNIIYIIYNRLETLSGIFSGVAILPTPQSVIFAPTRPEHLEKRYGFVGDLHIFSLKLV